MQVFEIFRKYIEEKVRISKEDFELIESKCIFRKLRKHQYLMQEGEIWQYHAFVCQGMVRKYTVDEKGFEHNVFFAAENWWTGDRQSLLDKKPTKYNIDAIEESVLLLIHDNDFQIILKSIPVFHDLINSLLYRNLNASHERINSSISLSAEEKYKHFLENSPGFANRLPGHMLASYLGMTPETLSRVRKQISKK